jgi:hypothetical protein
LLVTQRSRNLPAPPSGLKAALKKISIEKRKKKSEKLLVGGDQKRTRQNLVEENCNCAVSARNRGHDVMQSHLNSCKINKIIKDPATANCVTLAKHKTG